MEKEYFSRVNWKRFYKINDTLEKISLDNNISFVNDLGIYCNTQTKRCEVLTDGAKIHIDTRGHTSILSKLNLSNKILEKTEFKNLL